MTKTQVVVGCVIFAAVVALLVPVYHHDHAAPGATCRGRLQRVAQALVMYAIDNDDTMPPSGKWTPAVLQYSHGDAVLLACPGNPELGSRPRANGYAMNGYLAGARTTDTPTQGATATVLLFESRLNQPNAVGDESALCNPPVHGLGNYYAYLDGHVRASTVPIPITPMPRSSNR